MTQNKRRDAVFSGFFWKFAERLLAQGIAFVVSVVLARLLVPEVYGTVAIVMVFINIANVFVTGGFNMALIQKKDATPADFSTVFYCALAVSVLIYAGMYALAPVLADFYAMPELTKLLRVFSLSVVISSYNSIQHAYVSRHMIFKKFFFSTVIGTLISGVVGIAMAWMGFGVWALVAQHMTNLVIDSLVLSVTVNWHPKLVFSVASARQLLSFGWKCLAANLFGTVYNNLRSLLIGKFYTSADLAYYNKGKSFPDLISNNLSSTIFSVLFPAIANVNDSLDEVRRLTRKSLSMTAYILFPMMAGMAAVAQTMVKLLLTEKWLACVPYLQLACLYSMFHIITDANLQSINAIGRSDVVLKLEFIKKPVTLLIILIALQFDILAIGISLPVSAFFSMLVNMSANRKLIGYSYRQQLKDLAPPLVLSGLMFACVLPMGRLALPGPVVLLGQIAVGAAVYVLASVLTKNESFLYLKGYLINLLQKKRGRS